MANEIVLKTINELLGQNYYIPYYQRGYRWTEHQVTDLLEDIWEFACNKSGQNSGEFYCLQPIVVKEKQWEENGKKMNGWEVVDGQQRLTTIYLLIRYFMNEYFKIDSLKKEYKHELYTLRYQTRPHSETYISEIGSKANGNGNIDYYHMNLAYGCIKNWFESGNAINDRTDRENFLATIFGTRDNTPSIKVIWYQPEQDTSGRELFTRLNVGKIPLTNAELIKALFLSSTSFKGIFSDEEVEVRKREISLLWDEMERELGEKAFWAFLTNEKQENYTSKIELIFEMMSDRKKDEVDPFHTFLYFLRKGKSSPQDLWNLWKEIEQYYGTAREWFRDKDYYHLVGYLVAMGDSIKSLLDLSKDYPKDQLREEIIQRIRKTVNCDIDELQYGKFSHDKKIENILLLFNVESVRKSKNTFEFYPFQLHKSEKWSLEHIHAQHSEGIDKTKRELWLSWLDYHKKLLDEILDGQVAGFESKGEGWPPNMLDALAKEILRTDREKITWDQFNNLSNRIMQAFTDTDVDLDDMHGISNLALLSLSDNSALSNSVFEVKKREIIRMDKEGRFIPVGTRRVFLKYYSNNKAASSLFFWSRDDRDAYLIELKNTLIDYLPCNDIKEVPEA